MLNGKRSHYSLFVLLLLLVMVFAAGPAVQAQTSVFVNEIHYDNSGTDTGEAIEIAGPAGTDLTGWSLVLYNGNGGASYDSDELSGTIPDQDNGFGTVFISYPTNGVQNGSPDGITLVDDSGNVVQFLSYEGSFTADGGPADGMTSTDIGVSEGSSTPAGDSLQLSGTGIVYEDFVWNSPGPSTFGLVNADQVFGTPPPPADPLINEFVFNHTSTDANEFVEILGTRNADYSAFTLLEIEGDDSGAGTIDGAFTVGTVDASGFWTTGFLNNELENGTVTLLLVEGFSGAINDDLDTDDDGLLDSMPWTRLVDDVAVTDGGSNDHAYAGTILAPGYDSVSFTPGGASRIPNGTDTDSVADWIRNDFDGLGLVGFPGTIDAGEAVNTPGTTNAQLAVDLTPIFDIQFTTSGNDSPLTGQTVTTAGVVTAVLESGGDARVFIQDGEGPWNGLLLFNPSPTPSVGDVVQVTDEVEEFFGLTELAFSSADILAVGASVPAPEALATGDVSQEQWESVLVRVENATVVNDDLGFGEWSVDDGSGEVRVDDLGNYDYVPRNGDVLAYVQGPLNFSFGDFKIEPRNDGDVQLSLVCGDPATLIHEIQGSGAASPLVGDSVVIEGVVVGDFQENDQPDNGNLEGFFVQEEDGDADGNLATSEGIFVFDGSGSVDVSVGDSVRVAGNISEFFGMTEITLSAIATCPGEAPLPTPATVTLPADEIEALEAYEGMSVVFPQELVISEYFNFDRFGEIVLALPADGTDPAVPNRPFQPTAVEEPDSPETAALQDLNNRSRITLDDGRTSQNPDPAIHPNGEVFNLENRFRGGDVVQNATGVLNYSFGLYRIQPTEGADYAAENPRPAEPEDVGGNITVAAFNVLNYFTTIDEGQDNCGPNADLECRGADSQNELQRQRDKIVAALAAMDADVVGLIEIENDAGASTADLVEALNDSLGDELYDYIDTGFIGTDAIKQAFIYKTTSVTPVGEFAVLDSDEFVDPNKLGDPKNRPALAQTFMDNEFGDRFTAVVNHFKSKGSPCGEGDDHPEQGSCNLTRTLAAQVLADWLATDPTGTGASDVLIIGDLNSYDKEDPIDVLKANGYADLVFEHGGEFAYSFVFDGQFGYLDYAMANQAALSRITGTTVWHNNTDEPDILDYDTTFKQDAQDALYEPNAFRSSDHDPVIVGICERPDVVLTPDVLWPANHMYVDVTATVFVDGQAANGNATFVSVTSNEPDNGEDDGDTINDIVQIDDFTFQLRAERSGVGTGRVYTVTYEVLDACGGVQAVSGTVTVPLSLEGGGGRGRQNNPNR